MNKFYSHDMARTILKNTTAAGIKNSLFTIVGFPTETEEDFQLTLKFIEDNAEFINRASCASEFIMSSNMMESPERWNLELPTHYYNWRTKDNLNTIEIRKSRLNRLYELLDRLKIK